MVPSVSVPKSVHDSDRIRIFDWIENFIIYPIEVLFPLNLDDFFVVCGTHDDRDIAFVYMEMFSDKFADGFVCSPIYRRRLDFDLETSVGLGRYTFAFAACMYFDVYSHGIIAR